MRTLEDYLRDRPAVAVQMLAGVLGAARDSGHVELEVLDKQVVLHGSRRIFGSVRISGEGLRGHLNLPRPVADARLTRVEPLTKRIWFHRFVLASPADLDETFLGWVREATTVGQGSRGHHRAS